jgi:hypothetical protein
MRNPIREMTKDDMITVKIVLRRYRIALRAVYKEFSREP